MASYPRITAAICVILLIAVLSLTTIVAVDWIGPALAHGRNVEHENGKIAQVMQNSTGTYFMLKIAGGQTMQFRCSDRCLTSLSHMQRHHNENAPTDVYYIRDTKTNVLVAIDVD